MKRAGIYILAHLAALSLFLVVALGCFESVALDQNRYRRAYEQYERPAHIGIGMDELMAVTDNLLLYCQGERDTLDMQATIQGQLREVFNDREKLHMVDVRRLFAAGYTLRNVALGLLGVTLAALLAVDRRRIAHTLSKAWLWTLAGVGTLMLALGTYMAVDFTGAFTLFHLLAFDNDLWQLDPRTDVMINMFPEAFFHSIATAVVVRIGVALLVISALAVLVLRLQKKGARHE